MNSPVIVTNLLKNKKILIYPYVYTNDIDKADEEGIVNFTKELNSDPSLQKIFRQFGKAGIIIVLAHFYGIYDGMIIIDVRNSVKKTAKWLATGKI